MNTLDYIESSRKQFEYYKLLAEKTFAQLTDEQLNWRSDEEANSISIIVMHLHGEKEWRKREEEFELQANDRAHILSLWNQGWACLFSALDSVNNENADTLIYIRKMGHSITEAVNRQLAHYAYHVGQIVFIGRMLKGNEWASLSIPKGHSQVYNQEKFSQEKRKEHFTDQILKDKESKK
jgi:hypothetical protein